MLSIALGRVPTLSRLHREGVGYRGAVARESSTVAVVLNNSRYKYDLKNLSDS
jgi:hypothetical protein